MLDREILQMQIDRINRIESRLDSIEESMDGELKEILKKVHENEIRLQEVLRIQLEGQPALESIKQVINVSKFIKWMLIVIFGAYSMISVLPSAIEGLKKLW